jgi:Na+/proline symporter
MFFATVFTQVSDQPLMQRMLATANERDAKRTVVIGNLLMMASAAVFFFVGTGLWVFTRRIRSRVTPAVMNDKIFPHFIVNELPVGVVGVIIAGLFAAAMGAMSSTLNATAAVIVSDFYSSLRPEASAEARTRLARQTTLLAGGLATAMAVYLAWRNTASLWDEYLRLAALIGGGFPGVFALGLLTRRANAPGVMIGAVASIFVTWWVQAQTVTSVCFQGFVAAASCIVIGYLASFAFAATAAKKPLSGLTLWEAPGGSK